MATLRDHIRSYLGESYDKLTAVAMYDGQGKPDVVGIKAAAALSRFGANESTLSEFGKSYIGAYAARTLIPICIDYYMVQTRLVDNASRPAGVTPLGGEVGSNYNRVAALTDIDRMLRDFLASELPNFVSESAATASAGIRVSSAGLYPKTQDPWNAMDPVADPLGSYPIGYSIGAAYVILTEPMTFTQRQLVTTEEITV